MESGDTEGLHTVVLKEIDRLHDEGLCARSIALRAADLYETNGNRDAATAIREYVLEKKAEEDRQLASELPPQAIIGSFLALYPDIIENYRVSFTAAFRQLTDSMRSIITERDAALDSVDRELTSLLWYESDGIISPEDDPRIVASPLLTPETISRRRLDAVAFLDKKLELYGKDREKHRSAYLARRTMLERIHEKLRTHDIHTVTRDEWSAIDQAYDDVRRSWRAD